MKKGVDYNIIIAITIAIVMMSLYFVAYSDGNNLMMKIARGIFPGL